MFHRGEIHIKGDINSDTSIIMDVEQATIGQSKNPLWHKVRKGKITASNVGTIVKRRNVTDEFVKGCKAPKDISYLPAIRWGVVHEDDAVKQYVAVTENVFSPCGIFICKERSWLGATPDGLVHDTKEDSHGILEIKCPYSIRDEKPDACFTRLHFTDNKGMLKKNHKYYYQIQTQLHTSGYTWCDFVIWTPAGLHIERIDRDDTFFNNHVLTKLDHFYANHWTKESVT